jgi:TonB family protein
MRRETFAIGLTLSILLFAIGTYPQEENTPPETAAPNSPSSLPQRIRVGEKVESAALVSMVQPEYPAAAREAHVTGDVVLHCMVGKDGAVHTLEYISGPRILMRPAVEAVRQWRYRPMRLNHQALEVDTTITVVFALDDSGNLKPQPYSPYSHAGPDADDADPTADAQTIDPQFKADILHLFDVMHLRSRTSEMSHTLFQSLRPAVVASLPPTPNREKIADSCEQRLAALLASPEFIDREAALYAKYLSDEDVKALSDFYQTSAGQHFNDATAQLTAASSQAGQEMVAENLPSILRSLCADYPELQGEAAFCPKQTPAKKSRFVQPYKTPAVELSVKSSRGD